MKKLIIIFTLFLSQACNLSTMHKIDTKEDMKILYSEIAELRKKLNLNHLEIDDTLEKVAKEYAIKLGENRTLTHTLFGTTPMQRIHKYDQSFNLTREILASGIELDRVVNAWLNSPSHKEALINTDTDKIGGYRLKTTDNIDIFVVLFGKRKYKN
ncbi:putative lipoprotein [Borreliella burgdorferi 29805]|uniref:BB0689 family surface lipoprotein n=1 Tax=Borreliella burgdorferi TaxID=139 RepID=UPI00017F3AF8|nr:CAP domain-containing protein [Borreliella burgdorferi]EEH32831.1 putative lipoprotein [Borreliella burgdorferi 29805]MCD2308543.1 CAP domain-containing protein [Borreliella burgdorferi]MCD2317903.1 CAP domain-containing protein [Borreliella burgdorferi]MCD2319499.1 CAP domain-containing protein [Borreliella burgdorferi]MCD2372978.1 CAP domain-containing protein [Borreliella burgdorferi]